MTTEPSSTESGAVQPQPAEHAANETAAAGDSPTPQGDRSVDQASWPPEVQLDRDVVDEARDAAADGPRVQKSFYVTEEVADRVNRAVFWAKVHALAHAQLDDQEVDLDALPDSASALVESALWAEVLRLELLYNDGAPFRPVIGGRLRPGPGRRGVRRLQKRTGGRPPNELA